MKIALVSPYDLAHPGGVNNHVVNLAAQIRSMGHKVTIVAPVARDKDVPQGVVAISRSITTLQTGGSRSRVSLSVRASSHVKQLLQGERFDLVHLHNPLTPVVSVNFLRHRDLAPDTAMVATFHEFRGDKNPWFSIGDPLINRWIERLDGRIAVSEPGREFNNTYLPGDYEVIPNGIEAALFSGDNAMPMERYRDGRPVVLFFGRLEYRKGFRYLLRAWPWVREAVPNARLLVAGAYKKRHKRPFVRYARKHKIYGVRFAGPVREEDKPRFYRSADVFCAPSAGFESFGITLLESMAAGVPVVASDIPGFRSVLDDGVQGVLVEPREPLALAKAIIDLLFEPEQRWRMGEAGREKAAEYDWSRIARQVLDFYARVLAKRRGLGPAPTRAALRGKE